MSVGRWWVVWVESDEWRAGSRKVQQDPTPQQQIELHTSREIYGAAEIGRER